MALSFVLSARVLAEDAAPALPDDAWLEANGATIGAITVDAGDVFDLDAPGENRRLYRWVNRLHRNTRASVIYRLLLFKSGDPYSRRLLEESARILRDAAYLYDAEVVPTRYVDGRVDVYVRTRDVWSLQGGIGFGRSGGKNSTRFGLQDENFLGFGTKLGFKHENTVDRTTSLFEFRHPNLFGRRLRLELDHSDNSDGSLDRFLLARPFFSLDSRWSAGVQASSDDRVDSLYALGKVVDRFQHRQQLFEGWAGFSRGLANRRTRRFSAGLTAERDRFGPTDVPGETLSVPAERTLVYPWFQLESIEDGYFVIRDLDKVARREDRNLGAWYRVRLGWIADAFGADRDQARLEAAGGLGMVPREGQLLFLAGHAGGRFDATGSENVLAGGSIRYYLSNFGRHRFYAGLSADVARNLDPERQLLLGGDSGLRGYPLRYQQGDRRVLFTVEQRFYTDWHLFKLVRVGAAAFADVGRAWFRGDSGANPDGWLRDVGFGLRLGSSRTAAASLIHVDLAFPIDGQSSISNVQVLVTTHESF